MDIKTSTLLVTGGGSGIGKALAERFHALGAKVIIAGRRRDVLEKVAAAHPGMAVAPLDLEDAGSLKGFVERLLAAHPGLDGVIHSAGIMKAESLRADPIDLSIAESTVATNLLGTIRLTALLLPHLLHRPKATIMTVSSGLAFVALAATPTYSATKAAVHSYSQSLRHQLRETSVQVIELPPPYVQTELMGAHQASDPAAMPLAEYIDEVFALLQANPKADEVLVERVKPLRFAEASGAFAQIFAHVNALFPS